MKDTKETTPVVVHPCGEACKHKMHEGAFECHCDVEGHVEVESSVDVLPANVVIGKPKSPDKAD